MIIIPKLPNIRTILIKHVHILNSSYELCMEYFYTNSVLPTFRRPNRANVVVLMIYLLVPRVILFISFFVRNIKSSILFLPLKPKLDFEIINLPFQTKTSKNTCEVAIHSHTVHNLSFQCIELEGPNNTLNIDNFLV